MTRPRTALAAEGAQGAGDVGAVAVLNALGNADDIVDVGAVCMRYQRGSPRTPELAKNARQSVSAAAQPVAGVDAAQPCRQEDALAATSAGRARAANVRPRMLTMRLARERGRKGASGVQTGLDTAQQHTWRIDES